MRDRDPVERPNRLAIAVCAAAGLCLGAWPYASYVGWTVVVPAYAVAAIVIGRVSLRTFAPAATEKPGADEFLLAAWNAGFHGSIVSLWALVVYAVAWALVRLGALPGWWAADRARPWATVVSGGLAAIVALGMATVAATDIGGRLYPATAGARSPYLGLILERRWLSALFFGSLLGLALASLVLRPGGAGFTFVALLLVLLPTGSLENFEKRAPTADKKRGVDALVKVLDAAGFKTVRSPRTGLSSVDPLLTTVDLLARRADLALVLEVKAPDTGATPVEWFEGSRVQSAAWALEETLREEGISRVEPLLVLCGRPASDSLRTYADDHSLRLVVEDAALLDRIEATDERDALRRLADQLLPAGASAGARA